MAMKSISSADGKTWASPDGAGNPLFNGPALTVFRGELWGAWICTQEGYENVPFLFRYKNGKMPEWTGNIALNEKWRMIGRLSTTTLDDKFHMAYRGAASGKVYIQSSNTPDQKDTYKLINPGVAAQPFAYSPTVAAFQGSLILSCVDQAGNIYYTVLSSAGTVERAWTVISGPKTIRSPALAVYRNELYIVFTGADGQSTGYGKLADKTGDWSSFGSVATAGISASPSSAVHSDNKLYTSWTGSDGTMNCLTFDGGSWSTAAMKTNAKAEGSSGIGSLGGTLYVSYGQKAATSTASTRNFDAEGVVIWGSDSDSDDERDDIYYEKQEAMQAYRPKWLSSSGRSLPSPAAGESNTRWLSKLFCL